MVEREPLVRAGRARLVSTPLHMSGLALMFVAAGMAVSALVEVIDGGDEVLALAASSVVVGLAGAVMWWATRLPTRVGTGAVFSAVAWTWVACAFAGVIPFMASGLLPRFDDALFESMSGFTCTGSTVLVDIESHSRGVLFWRQMTQWYGGMGMIVLAVAVLPFLGVGGLELIRAEAPGPTSDRLAPRVSETARRLWLLYAGFTVVAAVVLMVAGLSLYDAVAHSFTLVSTGGFSTYSDSISHFDSIVVELVIMLGMVAGAANFTLHYRAVTGHPGVYRRSSEFRVYLAIMLVAAIVVVGLNVGDGLGVPTALRYGTFNVVALGTSTGYGLVGDGAGDFVLWVPAAQLVLLFLMISGGMTGSTSGGMKVLRVQVMVKLAQRELARARHPRAVLPIKLGREGLPEQIAGRIAGFVMVYFALAVVGILAVAALDNDIPTSVGGVASALGNMGPGLGEVGPASTFLAMTRPARMVIAAEMLIGRLEIFAVLLTVAATTQAARRRLVGGR